MNIVLQPRPLLVREGGVLMSEIPLQAHLVHGCRVGTCIDKGLSHSAGLITCNMLKVRRTPRTLQGFLAHKKQHSPLGPS